jgi:hypothetical protein
MRPRALVVAVGIAAGCAVPAAAQVEVVPFGGYRFGGRLEVRGFFTVLESDHRVFCGSQSGCLVDASGFELSQAEARGGLILRF